MFYGVTKQLWLLLIFPGIIAQDQISGHDPTNQCQWVTVPPTNNSGHLLQVSQTNTNHKTVLEAEAEFLPPLHNNISGIDFRFGLINSTALSTVWINRFNAKTTGLGHEIYMSCNGSRTRQTINTDPKKNYAASLKIKEDSIEVTVYEITTPEKREAGNIFTTGKRKAGHIFCINKVPKFPSIGITVYCSVRNDQCGSIRQNCSVDPSTPALPGVHHPSTTTTSIHALSPSHPPSPVNPPSPPQPPSSGNPPLHADPPSPKAPPDHLITQLTVLIVLVVVMVVLVVVIWVGVFRYRKRALIAEAKEANRKLVRPEKYTRGHETTQPEHRMGRGETEDRQGRGETEDRQARGETENRQGMNETKDPRETFQMRQASWHMSENSLYEPFTRQT